MTPDGFIELHDARVTSWRYRDQKHEIGLKWVGVYEALSAGHFQIWTHDARLTITGVGTDPGPLPDDEGWIVSLDLDGEDVGVQLRHQSPDPLSFREAVLCFNNGAQVRYAAGTLALSLDSDSRTRGELFTEDIPT